MTDIVNIGFAVDSGQIKTGTDRLAKMGNQAEKSEKKIVAYTEAAEAGFARVSSVVAGATAAVAGYLSVSKFVEVARQFDILNASLVTATGSAEAASDQFQQLANFAATTPYDLSQSVKAFVQLKNLGLDPSEAALNSYGNTAAAMGKDLNQMIEAVADATVGEFERLKEFGIRASTQGDNVSFTFQGITTTVKKSAAEIEKYLMNIGNVNFAGAMAQRAETLDGAISNLSDSFDGLLRSISQAGVGDELNKQIRSVTDVISSLSNNTDALIDSFESVSLVVTAAAIPSLASYTRSIYANVAAQLLQNTQAVKTVNYLGQVTVAAGSATVATNALSMASRFLLGPWGLLIAAVGTAITVYQTSKSSSDALNASLATQKERVDKLTGSYNELSEAGKESARFQLVATIEDLRKQSIEARTEINKLKKDLVFQDAGGRAQVNSRISELNEQVETLDAQAAAAQKSLMSLQDSDLSKNWQSLKTSSDTYRPDYDAYYEDLDNVIEQLADGVISYEAAQKALDESYKKYRVGRADGEDSADLKPTNKQIEALKQLQKQIGMTSDELFVYQQVQKSMANGDSPALTSQIQAQAQAYIDAKNAYESNLEAWTGQDQIDQKLVDWINSIETTTTKIKALEAEIKKTQEAAAAGFLKQDVADEYVADLRKQIKTLNGDKDEGLEGMLSNMSDIASSMSGLFDDGSKDAQKLVVAIQAINTALAVTKALSNASTGNIVGAISSGLALIASADSLLNTELTTDYEDIQANQFLNEWGEKISSIADSTELTSSVSEKLLGVNQDMLTALTNLTSAISDAAGIIVSGASSTSVSATASYSSNALDYFGWTNFSDILGDNIISSALDFLSFDWLFESIGSWFGGSSKVTDEGIRIIGGTLSDLIEDTTVQAYQSIKYKKWRWGSTKRKTTFANLSSAVSTQFELVFNSLGDAVANAASTLGYSDSYIQSMLDSFVVATKTISTEDMSTDEITEALEEYFGDVFNNLAEYVIPFVDNFQQTGEDLATTLTRLANEVAVADKITEIFGTTFGDKMANPEAYATAADNLAELAGGVEDLADQVSSFFSAFATDDQKLDVYYDTLTSALEDVGLTLPSTSEGLYDLMQTLDGTTESGQEQIATLLSLTDTASAYYSLLEDMEDSLDGDVYRDAADSLYELSEATKQTSLDAAIAAAQIGDYSLAEALDTSALAPDESDYSSLLEYQAARAETANKLNYLANLADSGTTIDEQQLSVLEEIRDSLQSSDTIEDDSIAEAITTLSAQMTTLQSTTNSYLRRLAYAE